MQVSLIIYFAALFGSGAVGLRPDVLALVILCLALAILLALVARALGPAFDWLAIGSEGAFLICSLGLSLACLSYVGAKIGLPIRDPEIAAFDRWLGFNWLSAAHLLDSSPFALSILDASYSTFTAQLVLTAVVLFATRRYRELDRYFVTFACASLLAEAASVAAPTLGPMATLAAGSTFEHVPTLGRTTAAIVLALRDGTLSAVDLRSLDGIISFPSLHAAVAVLVPYHLRWNRALFWPVTMLNLLMLASAIPSGNHYLSDILGGIVVAGLGIVSGRVLHAWLSPARPLRPLSDLRNDRPQVADATVLLIQENLAGAGGFEPPYDGIKIQTVDRRDQAAF